MGKIGSLPTCIKDNCGIPFDPAQGPQYDGKRTDLVPFWQRYCPKHRVDGSVHEPIVNQPA